jgi:hypothetical protein
MWDRVQTFRIALGQRAAPFLVRVIRLQVAPRFIKTEDSKTSDMGHF